MHRDLPLPSGFLPASKEPELQPTIPTHRPQTRSLKKPVVDPRESLREEEEDLRLPLVSALPIGKFSVEGTLPAQFSFTNTAVPEPVNLPAQNLPVAGESSLVSDPVYPSLLGLEEVSGEPEENLGEHLAEPEEATSDPESPPRRLSRDIPQFCYNIASCC